MQIGKNTGITRDYEEIVHGYVGIVDIPKIPENWNNHSKEKNHDSFQKRIVNEELKIVSKNSNNKYIAIVPSQENVAITGNREDVSIVVPQQPIKPTVIIEKDNAKQSLKPVKAPLCFPSATKDVYVRGYYRKDGTYVRPHYRSRPRR